MQLVRVTEAPEYANTPPPDSPAEFSAMVQSIRIGEHE